MEQHAVEQWVNDVVAIIEPMLTAQARMWHRLDIEAPPPEELAARLAADVLRVVSDW